MNHWYSTHTWLGSSLNTRPKAPWFNSQPVHYQERTLGKLFTPTCLCRGKRLVTFWLRFDSHCRHLQATLSKLLAYCVLRATQPPTLRGTGNE